MRFSLIRNFHLFTPSSEYLKAWEVFDKWLLWLLDKNVSDQERAFKAFKNGKRSGLVDRQQVRIIFFKFLNDEYSCE